MSDEFDSVELPEELRDVASRLRGLRPAASKAREAECMYRAGWQAALAANAPPATRRAPGWNKSYFGGLVSGAVSGALVAGALAASLMLSMAGPWKRAEPLPDAGRVARETVGPASGSPQTEDSDDQLVREQLADRPRAPVEKLTVSVPAPTDELIATALLSPVARHQWREILTQGAAAYASPRADTTSSTPPPLEPLRSSPRDIDHTWF